MKENGKFIVELGSKKVAFVLGCYGISATI
jgi:hypothetical protein